MKMSRRAQRMERHHKKHGRVAALNLVSLMDIFTILVFFLLVNSANVDVLPTSRVVVLPESSADQPPRRTVTVTVTPQDILVEGRRVADAAAVLADPGETVPALQQALEREGGSMLRTVSDAAAPAGPDARPELEVTVLADKTIPYRLLRKVMFSCGEARFTHASLAVLHQTSGGA